MTSHLFNNLYHHIIVSPLRQLYFYGPSFMQFGFWGGKPPSEICQTVTTYSEGFWRDNTAECSDIIENKFMSFQATVEVVVYFTLLYQLTRGACYLCILMFCRYKRQQRQVIYIPGPTYDHNHTHSLPRPRLRDRVNEELVY